MVRLRTCNWPATVIDQEKVVDNRPSSRAMRWVSVQVFGKNGERVVKEESVKTRSRWLELCQSNWKCPLKVVDYRRPLGLDRRYRTTTRRCREEREEEGDNGWAYSSTCPKTCYGCEEATSSAGDEDSHPSPSTHKSIWSILTVKVSNFIVSCIL